MRTDTANRAGYAAHTKIWDPVAAGMSRSQAIVAGTNGTADILGLVDIGSVTAGKSADFIVLDANPLENITNTKRISKVYLRSCSGNDFDWNARRYPRRSTRSAVCAPLAAPEPVEACPACRARPSASHNG